jgi:hypothetical protein
METEDVSESTIALPSQQGPWLPKLMLVLDSAQPVQPGSPKRILSESDRTRAGVGGHSEHRQPRSGPDLRWGDLGVRTPAQAGCRRLESSVVTAPGHRESRRSASRPGNILAENRLGEPYDQDTFVCLLEVERRRFERGGRPFLLILVDLKDRSGASAHLDEVIGAQLFLGLQSSLRATDFVGWYRQGSVGGAVLTEVRNRPRNQVLSQRLVEVFRARLTPAISRRLQVLIFDHPPSATVDSTHLQQLEIVQSRRA